MSDGDWGYNWPLAIAGAVVSVLVIAIAIYLSAHGGC